MSEYRWTREGCAESYEILLAPDGREVACITEPEDRTSTRDLEDVTKELNRLAAERDAALARVAELEELFAELENAARAYPPGCFADDASEKDFEAGMAANKREDAAFVALREECKRIADRRGPAEHLADVPRDASGSSV